MKGYWTLGRLMLEKSGSADFQNMWLEEKNSSIGADED